MLVAEAFADNDNARSGLILASDLFAKNVKDDEGHEHGADGKFVSTGGSSGSSKEKPSKAEGDAFNARSRNIKEVDTAKNPYPKRKSRIKATWYARKSDGKPFYAQLSLRTHGFYNGDGVYVPAATYTGTVQLNRDKNSAALRVRAQTWNNDQPDDPEHKDHLRAMYAREILEALKAAPDTHTFTLAEGANDEFTLEAFHDLIDEDGKPNTKFGKKTVACVASTAIAKQQIFKSLPKSIVEPAIAAVTRELGSCSCMPKQLGVLTDAPVIGVSAKSQQHALAWAMPSKDGHVVRLMSDHAKWKSVLSAPINDNNWASLVCDRVAPDKRADVTVTHEMGHVLEHAIKELRDKPGKVTAEEQAIREAYLAMHAERQEYAQGEGILHDAHLIIGSRGPSHYARTKPEEYFAECYAAYRHGIPKSIPPKARAFFDLLGSKEIEKALAKLWAVYGEPEGTSYDCDMLDYKDHTPKRLRDTAHAFANLRLKKSADWHEEEHPRDEYGKFTDGFASGDEAELSDPGDNSTPEAGSPFAPGGAHAMSGPGGFSTGTAQPMPQPEPKATDGKIKFADLSMVKDPDALDNATNISMLALKPEYNKQTLELIRSNGGDAIPHLVGQRFNDRKSAHAVAALLNEATDHNFHVHTDADGKVTIKPTGPQEPEPDADLASAPTFKPVTGWKKVGEQAGSNPGGVYKDKDGNKHYVKFYANENQAKNEALANSVYNVLGIRAPKSSLVDIDGKKAIANTMVDGLMQPDLSTIKSNVNAKKGFVADAFLANHDVVGLTADNMLFNENGHVYRIDNGGALKFRAMGGPKSNLKTDEVPELNSMRNPQYQAGKVFGSLTTDDMKPQAEHLVSTLTDPVIDDLIAKSGFEGKDALEYRELLQGRRDAIAKAFDITPPTLQFNPDAEAAQGGEADAAVPKPAGALSMSDIATAKPYPPTHVAWMAALAKFNEDGTVPANMAKNKNLVAYMIQHKWKDEGQGKLAAAIAQVALGKEVALELGASKKFHHVKVSDKPLVEEQKPGAFSDDHIAEKKPTDPDAFDVVAELMGHGKQPAAQSNLTDDEKGLKSLMLGMSPNVQSANMLDKYPNILAELKAEAKAGDAKSKALVDKYNEVHGLSGIEPDEPPTLNADETAIKTAQSNLNDYQKGLKSLVLGLPTSPHAHAILDKNPAIVESLKADAKFNGDKKAQAVLDAYEKAKAPVKEPAPQYKHDYMVPHVSQALADVIVNNPGYLAHMKIKAKNGSRTAQQILEGLVANGHIPESEVANLGLPSPKDAVAQAQSPDAALHLPTGWESMTWAEKANALKEASLADVGAAKYMAQSIEASLPESTPLSDAYGPAKIFLEHTPDTVELHPADQAAIQSQVNKGDTLHLASESSTLAAGIMKSKIPRLDFARKYADQIAEASGKPVKITVNPDGTFGLSFSKNGVADKVLPTPNSAAMTYPDDLQGSRTAPALSEVATSGPRENEGNAVVPEYKKPKLALDPSSPAAPKAPKSPKAKPEAKPASPHSYDDISAIATASDNGGYYGAKPLPPDIREVLDPLRVARNKKYYGKITTPEQVAEAKKKLFNDPDALAAMLMQAKKAYYLKPTQRAAYAKILSEAFGMPMVVASKGYQATVAPKHVAEANGWTIKSAKKPVKSAASVATNGDTWSSQGEVAPEPTPGNNASYAARAHSKAPMPHDIARWAPFVTNEAEQQHVVSQLRSKGFTDAADHLAAHYEAVNANPEMNSPSGMQDQIYPGVKERWGNPALAPSRLLHNAFLGEQNLPNGVSPKHLYAVTPEERKTAWQESNAHYVGAGDWLKSFYHHRDLAAKDGVGESWAHPQWNELYANAKGEEPSDYYFRGQISNGDFSQGVTDADHAQAPSYAGTAIPPLNEIVTPHGTFSGTHLDQNGDRATRVREVLPTLLKQHKEKGGPVADPFQALKPGQKPAPESAHAYAMTQRYYEPLLQAARASLPSAAVMQKMAKRKANIGGVIGQDIARQMYSMMGVPMSDVDQLNSSILGWLGNAQDSKPYYLRTAANMLSGLHPAANTLVNKDSGEKHESVKAMAQKMTPGFLKAFLIHKAITQAVAERFTNDEGTMPMIRGIGSSAAAVKAHTTKDKNGQTIARLREQSLSGYTTRTGAEDPFASGARIFRHVKPHEIWHGYRFSPSHGNHEAEQEHFIQHVNGGGYVPLKSADAPLSELKGNALLPGKFGKSPTEAYQAMKSHYGY
jgi:hypothetical protein